MTSKNVQDWIYFILKVCTNIIIIVLFFDDNVMRLMDYIFMFGQL